MGAVVHHRTHGSINNCFVFCLFICHLGRSKMTDGMNF